MITRREAMMALAAFLQLADAADAQAQAASSPVFTQDLPESHDGRLGDHGQPR